MSRNKPSQRYVFARKIKREELARLAIQFWSHVEPDPNSECLLWTGATSHNGYPIFKAPLTRSGIARAHRVAMWLVRGIVPAGRQVHHTCKTRKCVNAYHLATINQSEHVAKHNSERAADYVPDPEFIF